MTDRTPVSKSVAALYYLAIYRNGEFFYYCGTDNSRSIWLPSRASTKAFPTREEAEKFALMMALKEPELIGKLEVVDRG
jgi:hypothetical protein